MAGSPPPTASLTPALPAGASDPTAPTRETGPVEPGSPSPAALGTLTASTAALPATGTPTDRPAGPRVRTIALDPGHGGPEVGTAAPGLVEKDVNLEIARKLADLLRAGGYRVVLTRDSDRSTSPDYRGGGYRGGLVRDLQARVDLANAVRADLFVSIHNNGSADPSQSGTEVWYDSLRTFSDRNVALARLVEAGLLNRLRALGYPAVERGIKDDINFRVFQGRTYNLYVLGPGTGPRQHVPTQMPGVLGESLFLTSPGDAAMLRRESTLDAIAAGYRDAVLAYFGLYPN